MRIPKITILVSHKTTEYTIKDLSPFTTYHVNVSAIPEDRSYRPPAKITVTTQMAAPQPMVKPDFFGVKKDSPGVITVYLPQVSTLSLELSTQLREDSHCLERAVTRAFSLLKAPTNAFTIKNLLRHYAKQAIKHYK